MLSSKFKGKLALLKHRAGSQNRALGNIKAGSQPPGDSLLCDRSYNNHKNTLAVMDSSDIPRKKIAVIGGGLVRLYLDTLFLLVVIIILLVLIIIVSRLH